MTPFFPVATAQWPEQKAKLEEKLAECQKALETAASMEAVTYLQGQIATIRWLLTGAEPPARPGAGSMNYGSRVPDGRSN